MSRKDSEWIVLGTRKLEVTWQLTSLWQPALFQKWCILNTRMFQWATVSHERKFTPRSVWKQILVEGQPERKATFKPWISVMPQEPRKLKFSWHTKQSDPPQRIQKMFESHHLSTTVWLISFVKSTRLYLICVYIHNWAYQYQTDIISWHSTPTTKNNRSLVSLLRSMLQCVSQINLKSMHKNH